MYSIVLFVNENSVSLVPTKWILKDRKICKWPPVPAQSLIKKNSDSKPEWTSVAVQVLKTGIGKFSFKLQSCE